MKHLYSYVLKKDNGSAPNPFWGVCTLTICKPGIRRTAEREDWVIGTGSKNSKLKDGKVYDLADSLVYAMKVTDKKTLEAYDEYCQINLPDKLPNWRSPDWQNLLGDCIYDYSTGQIPIIRKSVHQEKNRVGDLSGNNALLSTHFYYFGEEPRPLPSALKGIIKKSQGYLKIEDPELIDRFEKWIKQFKKNRIYALPQLSFLFRRSDEMNKNMNCESSHC
jgi:hypothetical protein